MEYITVYEYTYSNYWWLHLISLLLLTLLGFFAAIRLKKIIKTFSYTKQIVIFFCYMLGAIAMIMLIFFLFNIPIIIRNEKELKEIIETKSYKVVEGEIEDFQHTSISGHVFERFSVQGVEFEYSDYIIIEGFHQTSLKGGPLRENGQEVRISYYTKENENLILKIEFPVRNS